MRPLVKFCGLTRREDAEEAVRCGASYLGVIFAGGPRLQTPVAARALLDALPHDAVAGPARRVGVFGDSDAQRIAEVVAEAALDVVQLHADPTPADVRAVRAATGREVWGVLRVGSSGLPARAGALFAEADAVVLDALVPGQLGGTGAALEWRALAPALERVRAGGRVVLAGGLRPENVASAIDALAPDVVDVSSGVEAAPGIKDHSRLRAFRDAVRQAVTHGERHG